MNRRQSGARIMLLSAGLAFVSGPTAWAADAKLGAPGALAQPPLQKHAAPLERAGTWHPLRSQETDGERGDPLASAAPQVEVRVGNHGEFERVAFEWPEPIEYEMVRQAEQVTVAFSRPGRIDVSRITGRLRRVVDAWAENGDATARVTLRMLPNARVRSFNLQDGRVAVDVFGGTAAQGLAQAAPDPAQNAIQELRWRSSSAMR